MNLKDWTQVLVKEELHFNSGDAGWLKGLYNGRKTTDLIQVNTLAASQPKRMTRIRGTIKKGATLEDVHSWKLHATNYE